MAEAYLTLSGCAAAAVSLWNGYEAGYSQVRYTTPTVDGQAVTVTVPAVLRGASFSGAHLSYTLAQDAGTAAVRFEGTGLAATDAAILEKLQRGETELRLYFSFRASGGSGGEGAHSAYAAWSDIRVKVGYLPPDGAQGTLTLPDGRQVEYSVHAHSLAPGESAGVTLRLAGGGARAFRLDMAGEGESAYDSFAAVPEDGMLAQTQMSVSQAQWTGRLVPARLRVTVTDENGEHTSAWQQSALTLCAYYLAPVPACAWTDESGVQTDFGAFVQGKSRMKISMDAGLDTAADAGATAVTRRLVLAGEEYLLGGNELEIGFLNLSGSADYALTVTDSHGLSGSCTGTLAILPYARPKLSALAFERYRAYTGAQGESLYEPDDGSDLIRVTAVGAVSPLDGLNAWTLAARYTDCESQAEIQIASGADGRALNYVLDRDLFTRLLSETKNWNVLVTLADRFESAVYELTVPKAGGLFNIERGGVAVGMRSTGTPADKRFEVNYPAVFYGGASFPGEDTGWLAPTLTDCQEYSSDYPVRARVRLGVLYLRGAIRLNALLASGLSRRVMVLPPGCAPSYPVVLWAGKGYGMSVTIDTNGDVTLTNRSGAAATAGEFFSVVACILLQ